MVGLGVLSDIGLTLSNMWLRNWSVSSSKLNEVVKRMKRDYRFELNDDQVFVRIVPREELGAAVSALRHLILAMRCRELWAVYEPQERE